MGKIWQPTSAPAVQRSAAAKAASHEDVANARVEEMMKKAVTTSNPAAFKTNGNGGIVSRDERIKLAREQRREAKGTLSQWYGMKRVKVTPEIEQEMNLLRYRSLVHKDGAAPKIAKSAKTPEFFETGYFVGVGKNRRRKLKSFADEWLAEDPHLAHRIERVVHRDQKKRRREEAKVQAKKKGDKGGKAGKRSAKGGDRREEGETGREDEETMEIIRESAKYEFQRKPGETKRQTAKRQRRSD
jgi:hypothetical protein